MVYLGLPSYKNGGSFHGKLLVITRLGKFQPSPHRVMAILAESESVNLPWNPWNEFTMTEIPTEHAQFPHEFNGLNHRFLIMVNKGNHPKMALFQVSELLPYIIIYHDTFSFSQCYELHPRYPLPMCRQPWIASAHALMRISSRGIRSSWENRPLDTMDHGTYNGWYWILMDLIYYYII